MSVEVGQLDMDVAAEGEAGGAPQAAVPTHPTHDARTMRELHAQWMRDASRTRAEGYGD